MPSVTEILDTMDYGPAPEANAHVLDWLKLHEKGFGHFINGGFTKPAKLFDVANPASGQTLARVSQGSAADVDAAVKAAGKAFGPWSKLSGHARAKYLYAIARTVQKRERFLSVLETMDNGKPIRESRDIDIPLVARHFYHHAGWAELIVELPAAYARLEDRAGTGGGQHGGAEARRVHALDGTRLRRNLPGGGPAAGCGQHRHG